MRTTKWLTVLVGGCALVVAGAGCSEPSETLVPEKQLSVSDIPVPSGFRIDVPSSEDKSSGNYRYVRHTYYGKSDPQLVRAFYRDQMPLMKWNIADDQMHQGQYKLRFVNELESCDILISSVKQFFGDKTKLELEVAPLDKAQAAKVRAGKKK
jgi:hypothetical protein